MNTDRQKQTVAALHAALARGEDARQALWAVVLAWQDVPFFTSSGLPFSYRVKKRKDGTDSGELLISRKEDSKTLTRSSIVLALRRTVQDAREQAPLYAGPKAIGQIFGISYVYSMFWRWGLIRVPEKVQGKLLGGTENSHRQAIVFAQPLCYNVWTKDAAKTAPSAGEIRQSENSMEKDV